MYVSLMDDSRIGATTADDILGDGSFEFTFPDDFDFGEQFNWKIVNGELVYDKMPNTTSEESSDISSDERIAALEEKIAKLTAALEALTS